MDDIEAVIRFTPTEQIQFEKEQNIYSIVKTMEFLVRKTCSNFAQEYAYMNGKIQGPAYDSEFKILFQQYVLCSNSITNFVGIDRFALENDLNHCQSAIMRIKAGKSNYGGEDVNRGLGQIIYEITSKMITANDVLEIGQKSVDEIAPHLREAHQALSRYPNLPSVYTGLTQLTKWTKFMESKAATYELSDDEIRELKYDLGHALQNFKTQVLGTKN